VSSKLSPTTVTPPGITTTLLHLFLFLPVSAEQPLVDLGLGIHVHAFPTLVIFHVPKLPVTRREPGLEICPPSAVAEALSIVLSNPPRRDPTPTAPTAPRWTRVVSKCTTKNTAL
jgi:hypothetical protein